MLASIFCACSVSAEKLGKVKFLTFSMFESSFSSAVSTVVYRVKNPVILD